VASGEAALAALASMRPDLVLMDIHLEGELDGIETARLMQEHGGPPVAYATAYTDPDTRARAQSTRPLAFLPKPVGPAELKALVQQLQGQGLAPVDIQRAQVRGTWFYRVRAGRRATQGEAEQLRLDLQRRGYSGFVTTW